jgi:hypothetical protein
MKIKLQNFLTFGHIPKTKSHELCNLKRIDWKWHDYHADDRLNI